MHMYKFPLRDVHDLKSRWCRKCKREQAFVFFMGVARFTCVVPQLAVVPLLYYPDACCCCAAAVLLLKLRGSVDRNMFLVDMCLG